MILELVDLIRARTFEFQLVLLNFQLVLLSFQLVTRVLPYLKRAFDVK